MPPPTAVSPVDVEIQLKSHPDRNKVRYLLNGFRYGFSYRVSQRVIEAQICWVKVAVCPGTRGGSWWIFKKTGTTRTGVGPTTVPPVENLHISRFAVIPKKGNNDWRLILDQSHPMAHSVNGNYKGRISANVHESKECIDLIMRYGRGTLMGKIDIKSAYRIIPIHLADRYLLGMRWREKYYVDLALPFGVRSAPCIFNTVAELFEWILSNNFNVQDLLHYLDDYFTLGPATRIYALNV